MKWLISRPWLLSLIMVGAVAIPGFFRVEQISSRTNDIVAQNEGEADCLRDIVNNIITRSQRIGDATTARSAALDNLLLGAIQQNRGGAPPDMNRLIDLYIDSTKKLTDVLAQNPLPQQPILRCPN